SRGCGWPARPASRRASSASPAGRSEGATGRRSCQSPGVPLIPLRDQLPTRKVPFVNYMIIAANVAVFFFERQAIASGITPQRILLNYGLIPARVWIDPGGALQTL